MPYCLIIDRSNGFEKDHFLRQNARSARDAEAHAWSVEDMWSNQGKIKKQKKVGKPSKKRRDKLILGQGFSITQVVNNSFLSPHIA
jgi:hypothetical protein